MLVTASTYPRNVAPVSPINISAGLKFLGKNPRQLPARAAVNITADSVPVNIHNAVNLIDGLDGLAAGTAAVSSLCIAYVAYIHGNEYGMMVVCLAMLALAGSCLGFLPFNFYPAKIFMGDGGSLFLGFMIAVLSVVGPLKLSLIHI